MPGDASRPFVGPIKLRATLIASRPDQALIWGQAGGSLKADSAGVWWCSMPFDERTRYASFVENQELIESTWDSTFGDRKNEIVFIGQEMDEAQIRKDPKDEGALRAKRARPAPHATQASRARFARGASYFLELSGIVSVQCTKEKGVPLSHDMCPLVFLINCWHAAT